jgi:hypothetical protein
MFRKKSRYYRGDLVEVRGHREILATLDSEGKLDGVPFMPEMVPCCGRRFRVFRRADKTCVEGYGVRRMRDTVFLEGVRCDGASHDGCQRHCLIFWKEAWLKPVDAGDLGLGASPSAAGDQGPEEVPPTRRNGRYFCQSTELAGATSPLSRWNVAHFFRDMLHGELTFFRLVRIVSRMAVNRLLVLFGRGKIGSLRGAKKKASKGDWDLRPGDWVEILTPPEIAETLNPQGKNGGLSFEPDMAEHCGRRYRVSFPIQKIISEETGAMVELTHTVALDGVTCEGLCAKNCPRSNPLYWRECWLRPVPDGDSSSR